MHAYDLILTLTGGLAAALILGFVTQRLGLSPIVGYLLAGTLVGPHTPGFVADSALAEQLAEIGVILLMFGVGLQFHIEDLLAVRRVAIPGAVAQSAVATLLGVLVARAFGWDWPAGVDLRHGAGRREHGRPHQGPCRSQRPAYAGGPHRGRVARRRRPVHGRGAGAPAALFGTATTAMPLWMALGLTAVKVTALVAFTAIVGTRVIPRLLDFVAATRSRELFTLTVLVIALGIAVGSSLSSACRWPSGLFSPGWWSGDPTTACGPPRRRCRCGTPSRCCSSCPSACSWTPAPGPVSRAGDRRPWRRAHRQADWSRCCLCGRCAIRSVGADGRPGIGADRRVLVHPGDHRPRARHPDHGSDERAGGDFDCVNRPESARLPDHRPRSSAGSARGRGSGLF